MTMIRIAGGNGPISKLSSCPIWRSGHSLTGTELEMRLPGAIWSQEIFMAALQQEPSKRVALPGEHASGSGEAAGRSGSGHLLSLIPADGSRL